MSVQKWCSVDLFSMLHRTTAEHCDEAQCQHLPSQKSKVKSKLVYEKVQVCLLENSILASKLMKVQVSVCLVPCFRTWQGFIVSLLLLKAHGAQLHQLRPARCTISSLRAPDCGQEAREKTHKLERRRRRISCSRGTSCREKLGRLWSATLQSRSGATLETDMITFQGIFSVHKDHQRHHEM